MEDNVYAAPQSDLMIEAVETGRDKSHYFRRCNWFLMILLLIFTAYIYLFYWIFNRAKSLNEALPNSIPQWMSVSYVVAVVVNIVMQGFAYAQAFATDGITTAEAYVKAGESSYMLMGSIAGVIGFILLLIWTFTYRARLNDLIDRGELKTTRVGPILTFFFSFIYLQYKINDAIDNAANN